MSVSAETASRISDRDEDASWRFGLLCVIAIGLIYGLVHGGLRLVVSDAVPIDDIKSNVYTQTLQLGYVAKQPPLYEWMLWLVQRLTGPTLASFLILKYALLTATFAFLYLIAKRIFTDYRWAMLAGLSPLFLYQIGWNVHEGVTQTMGLICAVAATMWAFMRLAERGRAGDYLLFGLTAGLGLITKYNFAGLLVVLFGSALLQPSLRARLFDWRVLLSLAVAALVVSPVAYWLVTERHDLVALYQSSIAPTAHKNWLQARADGLVKSVWVPFGFLFPLDVLILFFPGALREGWKEIKQAVRPRSWNGAEPDWRLLLLHMTLGGFIVLGFGALATGATHYLERYMHPFFLLTPIWLLALVETGGKAPRRLAILSTVLVVATVAIIPLRARDLSNTMAGACRKCRIAVPYEGLADALKARGFQSGTIIAATREDAGNLRRFFPEARIVRLERPRYEPPPRAAKSGDKLAVVWREGYRLTKEAVSEYNSIVRNIGVAPEPVNVALQNGSRTKRQFEWRVVVVDAPAQ
jgi:4-amino-4-deoxy-L-arabinose transferase-like glycosyltransferase